MASRDFITCRVTSQTKALVRAFADRQGVTESALLKQLVAVALDAQDASALPPVDGDRANRSARVYVRLEPADWTLLRERARARRLAPATYVSVLTRSHLRGLAPLPKTEYLELRKSLIELTTIGRNLNQIARALNQGQKLSDVKVPEVGAMLKVAVSLRDNVRALLLANERSWLEGQHVSAELVASSDS